VTTELVAPTAFAVSLSIALLAGAVLGGLGSLAGAVWGAVVLVLVPPWSSDIAGSLSLSHDVQSNLPLALYGVVLIAVIVAAPDGIQGALRRAGARLAATPGRRGAQTERSKRNREGGNQ
jgi:branched-chain amino acid transport system permease protein